MHLEDMHWVYCVEGVLSVYFASIVCVWYTVSVYLCGGVFMYAVYCEGWLYTV